MIYNYWPTWFRDLLSDGWPNTYCCVDVETSGYSPENDVVTEWGHCLVVDGQVTDQLSLVLDWTNNRQLSDHYLRSRLNYTRQAMELNGRRSQMTYERMQQEGRPVKEVFEFIANFVAELQSKKIVFVAHGGHFDEKMLSMNVINFGYGKGFTFGQHYVDTEVIEKASQILDNERVYPRRGDTLRDYYHRVRYTRVAGIKSNMDEHCYKKYDFGGRGIEKDAMHGARIDAYCCHLLMQEYAKQVIAPVLPPLAHAAAVADSKTDKPAVAVKKRVRGQRVS